MKQGHAFQLRISCLLAVSMLCSIIGLAQPVIQSFAPLTAASGSTLIISGSGFSSVAGNNVVQFGAVRATVQSATTTSLQVIVPAGATYQPITVNSNGLTAQSSRYFLPAFTPMQPLALSSFGLAQTLETDYYPREVLLQDLNLDNKPEVLVLRYLPNNYSPSHVLPYLNNSNDSAIMLQAAGSFFAGTFASDMKLADIDGDGLQDVITSSIVPNEISVLRNTSTSSSIGFATRFFISKNDAAFHIAVADVDGDGKPDIVGSNTLAGTISMYRNTSAVGSVSFAAAIEMPVAAMPRTIVLQDVNNDRKPDLLMVDEANKRVVVFRNQSTVGNIHLTQQVALNSPDGLLPQYLCVADLNVDGNTDVLFSTINDFYTQGNIYAWRGDGNWSFVNDGALPKASAVSAFYKPSVADMDADGKPDIAVGRQGSFDVETFRNTGTTGAALSFASASVMYTGSASTLALGDVNNDGSPDMITGSTLGSASQVFRNKTGKTSITNVSPAEAGYGATVRISGRNFTGTNSVRFAGINALSFVVESDTSIVATVGNAATGAVSVTATAGIDAWQTFTYNNAPQIDSFAPAMAASGDTVLIYGRNFYSTHTVQFGEVNATWFEVVHAGLMKAIPATGDHGYVSVQNSSGFYRKDGFVFLRKPVLQSFNPASAYKGQWLYLYGQHLALPGILPTVSIGGVVCPQVSSSNDYTQLMVVLASVQSGDIIVQHPGGADTLHGFVFIPAPDIIAASPMAASPTDTIRISGRYFSDVTQVKLGDSSAAWFRVLNDSMIVAVVGHGKTGPLTVTKFSGSDTLSGFVFVPFPAPQIMQATPNTGTAGTKVLLTGHYLWGIKSIQLGEKEVVNFQNPHPDSVWLWAPVDASGDIRIETYYGVVLLQPGFIRQLPPILTGFSPAAASPGDVLVLQGNGFGNNASAVQVWFGPVKANIVQINNQQLTVQVPYSAGYDKITVVVQSLSAISARYFQPLHLPTAGLPLRNNSFVRSGTDVSGGIAYDRQSIAVDLNNDGKPDLATLSSYNGLMLYRNTSEAGSVLWSDAIMTGIGGASSMEAADVDGDGMQDIVLFGGGGVVRNISTMASIATSFVPVGINATDKLADMNADGKPDLLRIGGANIVQIQFNTSTPGDIRFSEVVNITTANNLPFTWLANAADIDMDGAIDLIGVGGNYLHVIRNTGNSNQPAFTSLHQSYRFNGASASYYYPEAVTLADLNADGKPELLVQHNTYSTASFGIHENLSTPGNMLLGDVQVMTNAPTDKTVQSGDFNGDGKPDLLIGSGPWLYVYQNLSTSSTVVLGNRAALQYVADAACIADIDGDGKQDIATHSNGWMVLRNRMGETQTLSMCVEGNVTIPANVTGSSYQWQMNSGSGFANVQNDAHINGVTTATLQLSNVPGNWLNRQVRCMIDNGAVYSEPQQLNFTNNWTGSQNQQWHTPANWSCGVVPDEYTSVAIPAGKTVLVSANATCRYLWQESFSVLRVLPGVQLNILQR